MRSAQTVVALAVILVFAAVLVVLSIYRPQVTVYMTILAIGLALALQKYIASLFAHFVIVFSQTYHPGDRIRIGSIKGDVRRVGLLHTTLEEVGEDEKLGGEITGRIIYVPNMLILDQAVLNYSKGCSVQDKSIASEYMFDELRIPITIESNAQHASQLLESILKNQDEVYIREAEVIFQNGYPRFMNEALAGPRVLVYVEPHQIWIKGKFVAPVRGRNDLRSRILLQFLEDIKNRDDIKLA